MDTVSQPNPCIRLKEEIAYEHWHRMLFAREGKWVPIGGTFAEWPEHLSQLKILDPCCGSGHFLVAA